MRKLLLCMIFCGSWAQAFTLNRVSINQYSCVSHLYVDSTGQSRVMQESYVIPYYYRAKHIPSPVLNPATVCHDQLAFGTQDALGTPRLRLIQNVLNLWDVSSYWFYPLDNFRPATMISEKISGELKKYGIIAEPTQFNSLFQKLSWQIGPGYNLQGERDDLGMYLLPFIDRKTFISYCPSSKNGRLYKNPLNRILKEVLEGDTEGLYLGTSRFDIIGDPYLVANTMVSKEDKKVLIKESDLKKVWFYIDGAGNRIVPGNEAEIASHEMYFLWPLDFANPYIQKQDQKYYVVTDIQKGGSVLTHDKKFGCIPTSN